MNIIEAIKSGKPFKRRLMESWFIPKEGGSFTATNFDILAEDWEIEEKSITVTATQINEAYDAIWERERLNNNHCLPHAEVKKRLVQELGL